LALNSLLWTRPREGDICRLGAWIPAGEHRL